MRMASYRFCSGKQVYVSDTHDTFGLTRSGERFPTHENLCVLRLALTASSTCLALPSVMYAQVAAKTVALNPATMTKLADVDPRYLSYNVEAVEVTGGRFWKPYATAQEESKRPATTQDKNQPAGMQASMFEYRPPINLADTRLRKLAAALSPAFIRVSGTWRNTTFFQDDDQPTLSAPPAGFKGVMTRAQWKGVVDFGRVVQADLVTSFAVSLGVRDSSGHWMSDQANRLLAYTNTLGGHIAAAEFMNEPSYPDTGGAPSGYGPVPFASDVHSFAAFLKKASPQTIFLGPGAVGEGAPMLEGVPASRMTARLVKTDDLMKATGAAYDVFSYHAYYSVSQRCTAQLGPGIGMTADRALSAAWFNKAIITENFYAQTRDKYLPGKPIWLTETGEAGCGGDPWASTFLDSFRFLDELGSLAQRGVKTVMVNTLASSDYGMVDENTLMPRPDYWAALLWKRLMGPSVLDPGLPSGETLRIYAQCTKDSAGSVTLLVMNAGKQEQALSVPGVTRRWTLDAPGLQSRTVMLNGETLTVAPDGSVPPTPGLSVRSGNQSFPPQTITFLTFGKARNQACR